eukprot:s1701_g11.t1
MSKVPLLRLCLEEVSVPHVPLPAWAKPGDGAAGRVVATPPTTPPRPPSHHDVVPPWALESDEPRPATGRLTARDATLAFLEETAGKALEAQQAAEASAQQKHLANLPVNPHLIIPAGLKCKRKSQTPRQEQNLAPSSPWHGRRGNTGEAERKTLELTLARDRTSEAEEEARQARVQLRDKDQQIAPRVVTTKAQRQCGIKDPGGLSHSRQGYIAQLQREKASREEVQVALDAQRERSRYEQAFERQEDKYFAAQAAAHALQLEIQEAEARALWRAKCRDVQEDVIQQRQEFRARKANAKECEGATGYQIGRDVLGDLRALQQSKLQNAQLRADDLLARRQRKQQEARDAKEQDQAAAEMMLAHAHAHHACRIARRESCLTKQCFAIWFHVVQRCVRVWGRRQIISRCKFLPHLTDRSRAMSTLSLMSLPKRVVIVGYGPVGHILLEHLVEGTEVALEITVICEEPRLAYNRVAMTSYFQHRSPEELAMVSMEWLEEKNVQLIFARATCIKRAQKRVVYEGVNVSGEMEYDELVLATGSNPFDAIIARASGRRRAAVIGGGLLGLEAAKALLDLQMNVSVLEVAPFLMSAQLDQVAGELLEKRLSKLGLSIHTAVELQEVLCNEDGVRFVRLRKDGVESFLEVDLLIVSCGIRPRDELARDCQLELGERGGVKVDCCLRSSEPNIYAVGEVASYEGGMVYGLWKPGAEQAEVLAATLGSPSAGLRYHGSDLSTKLKLLGVNVASFGANAEFWKHRMFDFHDGQAGICVQSALDPSGRYRKLVFRRLPGGSRRLLGGRGDQEIIGRSWEKSRILVESVEDYQSLCDLARCGRELWGLETVEDMVYPKHLPAGPGVLEMGTALRVVIVGHGPVGNALIENLLEERERNVAITVLCEEPRLAYNRVAMTSYFQHRTASELSMVNIEWLQEKNVQLIFARATSIKRSHKRVTYQGIFKSSAQDAIIARAQSSRRAAVIGGGLLGLEAAKALMDLGMETHIIESAPHLMPSQLDTVAGDLLKRQVESLGCVVHVRVQISEIFSDETGVQAMRFVQAVGLPVPPLRVVSRAKQGAGAKFLHLLLEPCLGLPPVPILAGVYGFMEIVGDRSMIMGGEVQHNQGVFGTVTDQVAPFVGKGGAGADSASVRTDPGRCKCVIQEMPGGEIVTTNRCNLVLNRVGGRKFGDACAHCHVHPLPKKEYGQRPSKAYSKAKRVDKQPSVTTEARERMSAISSSTHAMQMDLRGVVRAGKLQQTSAHLVSVSAVTVGRNLERAQATVAKAEQVLELAPDSVFILSNYDFKNPSHYKDLASAQGFKALFAKATWHLLLEDDAVLTLTGEDKLAKLANTFGGYDLSFLGYFSQKQHAAPPYYGTQCYSVARDFIPILMEEMGKHPAVDIDMFWMLKLEKGEVMASNFSFAGQGGHMSDCRQGGGFASEGEAIAEVGEEDPGAREKAGGKEGSRWTCPQPVWLFGDADALPNLQMRSQRRGLPCAKGNWAASRNSVQKVLHAAKEGEEEEEEEEEEGVAV